MRGDTQRLFDEALDNKWGSWIRLSRDSFYITHVRKCLSTVNNLEHTEICRTIFDGEIKIIQPRLIIAMGEESFEFLCPNCDYKSALGKITKSRYGNVYTTYYPAGTDLLDNEVIETFKKHIALISRLIWESECPF
jgi:uracil-DNA glycosylase family 4